MAYQPNAQTFTLQFNEHIWSLLDQIAVDKGYKGHRQFIKAMTRQMGTAFMLVPPCTISEKKKKQNMYEVPRHMQKSFAAISCQLGLPISTIMMVRVLWEAMDGLSNQQLPDNELPELDHDDHSC
jgi:hypothetical protein